MIRNITINNLIENGHLILPWKWIFSRKHAKQNYPKRPNVTFLTNFAFLFHDFRWTVKQSLAIEPFALLFLTFLTFSSLMVIICELAKAKVDDMAYLMFIQKNIIKFKISMCQIIVMQILNNSDQVSEDCDHIFHFKHLLLLHLENLTQSLPFTLPQNKTKVQFCLDNV